MATLKHIASKNSDYTAIEAYPVSYTHLDVYKRQRLHHIPESSFLASKSDLHDLHFHPVVTDLGEKPEKAADGRVFPITVLSRCV